MSIRVYTYPNTLGVEIGFGPNAHPPNMRSVVVHLDHTNARSVRMDVERETNLSMLVPQHGEMTTLGRNGVVTVWRADEDGWKIAARDQVWS